MPNVYMTYPQAQPQRQLSQQQQSNVALSREASRRGFKSVAEMQAASQGGASGAQVVSQKDRLDAARKQWAAKAQAEGERRVAMRKFIASAPSRVASNLKSAASAFNPYGLGAQYIAQGLMGQNPYPTADVQVAVGPSGYAAGGYESIPWTELNPYFNAAGQAASDLASSVAGLADYGLPVPRPVNRRPVQGGNFF